MFTKSYKDSFAMKATFASVALVGALAAGIAIAAGGYTISQTGTAVVNGNQVTIQGEASAQPYVGTNVQQFVSIDWNNNGTWTPATSFTPTFS